MLCLNTKRKEGEDREMFGEDEERGSSDAFAKRTINVAKEDKDSPGLTERVRFSH